MTGLSTLDIRPKGPQGEQLFAVTRGYAQASSYYGQVFDNLTPQHVRTTARACGGGHFERREKQSSHSL
jgi:hypothetical protein